MIRILIAGGPRTGKTTLSNKIALSLGSCPDTPDPVIHTDDLIGKLDWSAASAEVATWFDRPGPWIIEGVSIPRALRKWLLAHQEGKPCDEIIWLTEPRVALSSGQEIMRKGCVSVWNEILPALLKRGVVIKEGVDDTARV